MESFYDTENDKQNKYSHLFICDSSPINFLQDQADMSDHYTDSDSFLESAMVGGASKELLIKILNNWETPKGQSYEFDYSTMVSGFCHLSSVCVFFWGGGCMCAGFPRRRLLTFLGCMCTGFL